MQIVDSAESVALDLKAFLSKHPELKSQGKAVQPLRFLVTDGIGRFMQVAEIFLEAKISADDITLVDL
jgi:glutamate racemase